MKPINYLEESARTAAADYPKIAERLASPENIDLLHGAMGLSTEANELVDAMKKVVFYGKPVDAVNLKEEIGDALWYIALLCRRLNVSMESIMQTNIDKLKARYPQKFTEEAAMKRDLDVERKILETPVESMQHPSFSKEFVEAGLNLKVDGPLAESPVKKVFTQEELNDLLIKGMKG